MSIDTLRADATTPYGAPPNATPALAAFATAGTVFERAFSQSNETLFSHASLFTSRMPGHLAPVDYDLTIPDGTPTLASALRDAGWNTGAIVGGGHLARVFGLDDGFSDYIEGDKWGSFQQTVPLATRWIEQHADERFFLFVHGYDCHTPYVKPNGLARAATPGYAGTLLAGAPDTLTYERIYDGNYYPTLPMTTVQNGAGERILTPVLHEELPRWAVQHPETAVALTPDDLAFVHGLYGTGAAYADLWLEELLRGLESRGLAEGTLVVVLSDHGEELLDHGFVNHRNSLQDASTQVPLVLRGPGVPAGARVPGLVELRDVAPTVLDLAGVGVPATMEGRSLRPCFGAAGCAGRDVAVAESLVVRASATDGQRRLVVEHAGEPAVLYDSSGAAGTETGIGDAATTLRLLAALRAEGVAGVP